MPGFVYTTALCGSNYCVPTVTDMTIMISGVVLDPGQHFFIGYTDAAAPKSAGSLNFMADVTTASRLSPVPLRPIHVRTCPNGVGTLDVSPRSVFASTTHQFEFTYTAGECGLLQGSAVTIDVPTGWSRPSKGSSELVGTYPENAAITLTGSRITITNAVLKQGGTLTVQYSSAVPASPGDTFFYTAEQTGDNAALTDLLSPAQITVRPTGGGTMTVSPLTVTASRRSTLTFTYTAPPGGLQPPGMVTLTVPPGWTAPRSKSRNVPGYTRSTTGTVWVSGRRINVTGARLPAHGTLKITYRDGTAPRSTGQSEFRAFESESKTARLSPVAPPPVVTVAAAAVPRWRDFLLGVALGAVCATLAALGTHFLRERVRARAAQVTTVSHRDPPRVAPIHSTGSEPTLTLRIEPHAGTTVRTLESKS